MKGTHPELRAVWAQLLELFPENANRISTDALYALIATDIQALIRLEWITLVEEPGLGIFYAPAGELLAQIKKNNPNLGALAVKPKGRWFVYLPHNNKTRSK